MHASDAVIVAVCLLKIFGRVSRAPNESFQAAIHSRPLPTHFTTAILAQLALNDFK